ncbi:2-amino-4-hydroxy-6-hydroxymethyldihydropteridine diphosphokinase [Jiella pacifica]|uniref:2-amino-4-hydroxy-6-hydroxymethyldihydropteridine pyrophosphokinase n=1 Tax=Jiella pacifica TaxID=2696469 RepID=A0A6N9T5U5_9HYPH|nr:2-amino-4-hydroxy-6-hydroxymethyldihydropteridine diphosphokinase [Jiella pacifica]NDW05436.1 2-amino-4-hydroxy-6-hydroxymethyldihydropteridine diphosphokinase [Jiella pacifica]
MSVRAHLGLGGNLGDPRAAMAAALQAIDGRADCAVVAVSRLFRTPPWGKTDQPDFLNACATVETELSARQLLDLCLETERAFKRERAERWGPRTLDIDLLDFGGTISRDEALTLPHPRAVERAFVLVPLADIAPDLAFGGRRVAELVDALDTGVIAPVTEDGAWWR